MTNVSNALFAQCDGVKNCTVVVVVIVGGGGGDDDFATAVFFSALSGLFVYLTVKRQARGFYVLIETKLVVESITSVHRNQEYAVFLGNETKKPATVNKLTGIPF